MKPAPRLRPKPTHVALNWRAIVVLREDAGLSQAELARLCHWTPQYQERIESGEYPQIPIENYRAIRDEIRKHLRRNPHLIS